VGKGSRARGDRAEIKARLAALGQDMSPDAQISYVDRPADGEGAPVILLDRVVKDQTPEYCTHGYAECVRCYHPCWLGDQTQKVVTSGDALPLCMVCAGEVIPAGAEALRDRTQLQDHRRADGPH
jgi:hypothetical protein